MKSPREAILGRIRKGIGTGGSAQHPPAAARPKVERNSAGRRFVERLKAVSATVAVVVDWEAVGQAVALYLHGGGQQLQLTQALDPELQSIRWPDGMDVRLFQGKAQPEVGLSLAIAGVVETGSVVLASGPEEPTALNFLSDTHIIVLPAKRLVMHLEDVWPRIRKRGAGRAVNFITGPSRSADVEQTLQLGAHGPRSLHIILIRSV